MSECPSYTLMFTLVDEAHFLLESDPPSPYYPQVREMPHEDPAT